MHRYAASCSNLGLEYDPYALAAGGLLLFTYVAKELDGWRRSFRKSQTRNGWSALTVLETLELLRSQIVLAVWSPWKQAARRVFGTIFHFGLVCDIDWRVRHTLCSSGGSATMPPLAPLYVLE